MEKLFSLDARTKMLQAAVYFVLILTLITHWDLKLFIGGLAIGWVLWLVGIYGNLHKYSSHRSFEYKNVVFKLIGMLVSTLSCLGSNISWAAVHRKHHKFSDQSDDPHSIHNNGGGFWNGLKIYFYYFPTYVVNPRTIKDLMNDPIQKWFHKHYFKIIFSVVAIIYLVDPLYVGYFFALPVVYGFTGISYITVTAHSVWVGKLIGYRNFDISDHTWNNSVASLLFPGEGNHNNHHANPGLVTNKMTDRDIDIGEWYIKLVGTKNKKNPMEHHHT